MSFEQAVLVYRDEFLFERGFGRIKGRSLSLAPMYLADEGRATALIRWLTVGLRVLTLLDGVVPTVPMKAQTVERLKNNA
ncbi:hypothetical protein [Candidatus Amarolinea dominans]|uniref:hypothetical protein n=1 Tax=Candidatus Amarolinea dominans TaxID=3140696 RepID=UPI001D3C50E8|nr:hypothetical protein [Anaerolineae bacterium]